MCENDVPAENHVTAEMFEIGAPKFSDVVTSRKISRLLQTVGEGKLWENSWVVVAGSRKDLAYRKQASRVIPTKSAK